MLPTVCAQDEAGIEARRKEKKPRGIGGQIELTTPGKAAFRAEELTKRGIINLREQSQYLYEFISKELIDFSAPFNVPSCFCPTSVQKELGLSNVTGQSAVN